MRNIKSVRDKKTGEKEGSYCEPADWISDEGESKSILIANRKIEVKCVYVCVRVCGYVYVYVCVCKTDR